MTRFILEQPRGYSLRAAAEFYAGFTPGSGMAAAATDCLTLVFRLDRTFDAVGVVLREERGSIDAEGKSGGVLSARRQIVVECVGTDDERAVSRQLGRMLGLDADGDAWHAIGARDPVVGRLQAEFPGFFTAAKPSPYDAATWGVIASRLSIPAAAKLKTAIAAEYGDAVRVGGRVHHVFPSPAEVARIDHIPGLPAEKLVRLKGIAQAAAEGRLEADRLRAMSEDDALAELQTLRGVGPWTASHILFRGAAVADALPTTEPRVLHGLADAYGIASPSMETLAQLAELWRPFRMWVCILLARHLHRAGGWQKPGLVQERAAAGRAFGSRVVAQR
jgi:DNA-3-methyladenine glycosylase II